MDLQTLLVNYQKNFNEVITLITWAQIWEWVLSHIGVVALVLSLIIQITPIKLNPWTAIGKWFSKIILQESDKKIERLIRSVDDIRTEIDTNEKDRIRWEVLDFANSCRNNVKHTHDEYRHIIALNDKYTKLLAKSKDINGVFDEEYKYISKLYADRLEKNDFL